jgi:hypothetical protein
MGLAERRAAKNFEDHKYPDLKADVIRAAGFDVPIEVKWDSISLEDFSNLYEDSWPNVFFKPLIEAFKAITVDNLGKEALKNRLKEIVITYDGSNNVTFVGGKLTLSYHPVSNVDYWAERKTEILRVVEKNL